MNDQCTCAGCKEGRAFDTNNKCTLCDRVNGFFTDGNICTMCTIAIATDGASDTLCATASVNENDKCVCQSCTDSNYGGDKCDRCVSAGCVGCTDKYGFTFVEADPGICLPYEWETPNNEVCKCKAVWTGWIEKMYTNDYCSGT